MKLIVIVNYKIIMKFKRKIFFHLMMMIMKMKMKKKILMIVIYKIAKILKKLE